MPVEPKEFEDKINKNCLLEMRCPRCFSAGPFNIVCVTEVEMHDDGSEKHGVLDHDNDSHARCLSHPCRWSGTVGQMHEAFEILERLRSSVITEVPVVTKETFDTFLRDVKKDFTLVTESFGELLEKKNPILLHAITDIAKTMGELAEKDPDVRDARSNALLGALCAVKLLYNQDEVDQLEAAREA